jgi:hypothetical protein
MIRPLFALACLSLPQALVAQHLLRLSASPEHPLPGQSVTVTVEFSNPRDTPPWCGLMVRFGDRDNRDDREVRVDATPLTLHKTYASPGVYKIGVDGQLIVRGLKTAFPCGGSALSLRLEVQAPPQPPVKLPEPVASQPVPRQDPPSTTTPPLPPPPKPPAPRPSAPVPTARDRVFPR